MHMALTESQNGLCVYNDIVYIVTGNVEHNACIAATASIQSAPCQHQLYWPCIFNGTDVIVCAYQVRQWTSIDKFWLSLKDHVKWTVISMKDFQSLSYVRLTLSNAISHEVQACFNFLKFHPNWVSQSLSRSKVLKGHRHPMLSLLWRCELKTIWEATLHLFGIIET